MPNHEPAQNAEIAAVLRRVAELLEAQDAEVFRVRAYRAAARTVAGADVPFSSLVHEPEAIKAFSGIGDSIARAIQEYVATGHLRMLDRLEGQISPEDLFTTVPGIGEGLAHRIHDVLQIDTLEELELAAHDGRLEKVPGFSKRRTESVRHSLQAILTQSARFRARKVGDDRKETPRPPVALLLEIDATYRQMAVEGKLRMIAPKRFNELNKAWLPIMHSTREGWHFTVLFSNSARAHRLGKTHDWVIIFYERDGHENQCTVVTEHAGPLKWQRVVRGREEECQAEYDREEVGAIDPPSPVPRLA